MFLVIGQCKYARNEIMMYGYGFTKRFALVRRLIHFPQPGIPGCSPCSCPGSGLVLRSVIIPLRPQLVLRLPHSETSARRPSHVRHFLRPTHPTPWDSVFLVLTLSRNERRAPSSQSFAKVSKHGDIQPIFLPTHFTLKF